MMLAYISNNTNSACHNISYYHLWVTIITSITIIVIIISIISIIIIAVLIAPIL